MLKQNFTPIVIDLPFHGNDNSEGVFDCQTAVDKIKNFLWFADFPNFCTYHNVTIFAFGLALNCYPGLKDYNGTIFLYSPTLGYDMELLNRVNKLGYKKQQLENGVVEFGEQRKIQVNLSTLKTLKDFIPKSRQDKPNFIVLYPKNENISKIKNNEKFLKKYKNFAVKNLQSENNDFDEAAKVMMDYIKNTYSYYKNKN